MSGVATSRPANLGTVTGMLGRMSTRGPDAVAAATLGAGTLGVCRLAITDVTNGTQPVRSASGALLVGFNGAIYNHRALARRYDLTRRSGSDAEVIAPLYERFGLRFADQLEGMYAIALVDDARDRLVLAVDPLGIKPLYAVRRPPRDGEAEGWLAASIPQALPAELRSRVWRVPPGTVWTSDGECVEIAPRVAADSPEELGLETLLDASVREQIPDEVSWGCLLSGGVDSSTVAALAVRAAGVDAVIAYTAGVRGSADLDAAVDVAALLGCRHRIAIIEPAELPHLLDTVAAATATPDPFTLLGGVGTWVAARRAARDGVKVLLSGEGADELYAGYDGYAATPPGALDRELLADQLDLGATECLRVDRCTMAHGIETRVPFLCAPVIRHARSLSADDRIAQRAGQTVRKVAVRRAARTLLPERVAQRPKAGIPDGAGLTAAIEQLARRRFDAPAIAALRADPATFGYFDHQRALGVDDAVAALAWDLWRRHHGGLGESWRDLVARGLVRRPRGEGKYRGDAVDAVTRPAVS
ncbi:MAG: asparagine synthase-related protein [Acidobacteriota bacterium]